METSSHVVQADLELMMLLPRPQPRPQHSWDCMCAPHVQNNILKHEAQRPLFILWHSTVYLVPAYLIPRRNPGPMSQPFLTAVAGQAGTHNLPLTPFADFLFCTCCSDCRWFSRVFTVRLHCTVLNQQFVSGHGQMSPNTSGHIVSGSYSSDAFPAPHPVWLK